jgi:hypothetical protein
VSLASRFVDVDALPCPAGSRHEAWGGPQGGLMLAIFQIPNKFFQSDGRETDQLGNDWEKSWGRALKKK